MSKVIIPYRRSGILPRVCITLVAFDGVVYIDGKMDLPPTATSFRRFSVASEIMTSAQGRDETRTILLQHDEDLHLGVNLDKGTHGYLFNPGFGG
jgi:hypothetical protein